MGGGNSHSRRRGFEPSTGYWMDISSPFFTYNVAKIVTFVEKNPEMIKEAEVVPFKKNSITTSNHICGIVQETCSTKLFSL